MKFEERSLEGEEGRAIFHPSPFAQEGGIGNVFQLFSDELNAIIKQLNETLAA